MACCFGAPHLMPVPVGVCCCQLSSLQQTTADSDTLWPTGQGTRQGTVGNGAEPLTLALAASC